MTDYSQFELTAYQRGKLAPDEQVFWCGKTRATAWFDKWPITVIFGMIVCAFVSPFVLAMRKIIFCAQEKLVFKIAMPVLVFPFAAFGLICLLSPALHWLLSRGGVWAITDRRVVRFFGPFVKSWWREKMFDRVEWSESRHGCRDFAFAEHWVSSKGGGHMATDCIANVRKEDVPFVEAAFHRLEEIKRAGDAVRQSEAVAAAEKCFRVFTDAGCTRIVYRRRRIVKGIALLTFVLAFFATMAWFVFVKGNEAHWIAALFCLPLILACAPSVYDLFGRREVTMANGQGVYFNGVGSIGLRRQFTYDATTTIRIGKTRYMMNGKALPEVQLLTPGQYEPRRLFAHPDEAVVEVFVRYMRRAMGERR